MGKRVEGNGAAPQAAKPASTAAPFPRPRAPAAKRRISRNS